MNKKYLISTSIKETWPKLKKNTLVFNSESGIEKYQGKEAEYKNYYVSQSRWSDKKKMGKDYKYLNSFYEILLKSLVKRLNSIHSVNYSLEFWRIAVGAWLSTFLEIYYERWISVEESFLKHKISNCIFLKLKNNFFIPHDHEEFIKFVYKDLWNQFIYQDIIVNFLPKNKIKIEKYSTIQQKKILDTFLKDRPSLNTYIKKNILKFFNLFNSRNYNYFFYNTYLGFKNELKLSLKFFQLPVFPVSDNRGKFKEIDLQLRKEISNIYKGRNKFEKSFIKILPEMFPKVFLENYEDLEKFSKSANIPQNPKLIFSSNALSFQTKITYHIAKLKEKKVKLVYGQHGGAIGISKYHSPEKHERKVADKYLTWGWDDKKSTNIKKFFIFKKIGMKKKLFAKKNLLFMLRQREIWFASMESSDGTVQFSDFIKYCSKFLFSLDDLIKTNMIIRPPKNSGNVDFYSNLKNNFNFYNENSMKDAFNNSKLIIHPCNSTPLLESFSANFPAIIIFDKKINPIRGSAIKYLDSLYDNNILFNNPVHAAKFVNKIWNKGVNDWWNKQSTQRAVKTFSDNFAKTSENITTDLKNLLLRS